jgi:hypothetical protein
MKWVVIGGRGELKGGIASEILTKDQLLTGALAVERC